MALRSEEYRKKISTTVYMDPCQVLRLKKLAIKKQKSEAEVIRDAIDFYCLQNGIDVEPKDIAHIELTPLQRKRLINLLENKTPSDTERGEK